MEFLSDRFHATFGADICLYEFATHYRHFLICPIKVKGKDGFLCGVFNPNGSLCAPNSGSPIFREHVFATPELAIEAGKRYVDADSNYWDFSAAIQAMEDVQLLDNRLSSKLFSRLDEWHKQQHDLVSWEAIEQCKNASYSETAHIMRA